MLSFFLMFVIMAVATDTRAVGEAAAIAIGGTVGLDAMFGGPVTGASMNPARSLGPAIASGELSSIWVYLAAPLLGAALRPSSTSCLRTGETAGRMTNVLFVCIQNAGRSQISQALFERAAGGATPPARPAAARPRACTRRWSR